MMNFDSDSFENWDATSPTTAAVAHHHFQQQLDPNGAWGLHMSHGLKHHHHLTHKATSESPMHLTLPLTPAESPMLTALSLSTAQSSNSSLHSAASMDHAMFTTAPQPFLEYLGAPSTDGCSTDSLFNAHLYGVKPNPANGSFDEHNLHTHLVLPSDQAAAAAAAAAAWGQQQNGSPTTLFDDRMYAEMPTSPPAELHHHRVAGISKRGGGSRRVSKSGSARFTCSEDGCSKSFKRMEHLSRHLRMHSGERPFICSEPDCGRKFSRSDNLQAHK
jgi:hypothetical protein